MEERIFVCIICIFCALLFHKCCLLCKAASGALQSGALHCSPAHSWALPWMLTTALPTVPLCLGSPSNLGKQTQPLPPTLCLHLRGPSALQVWRQKNKCTVSWPLEFRRILNENSNWKWKGFANCSWLFTGCLQFWQEYSKICCSSIQGSGRKWWGSLGPVAGPQPTRLTASSPIWLRLRKFRPQSQHSECRQLWFHGTWLCVILRLG